MSIKVDSVQREHNSMLPSVARTMVAGGIVGYAAKYVTPLTADEKNDKYKAAIKIIKKNAKEEKGEAIEQIRKIPVAQRTPAQDVFIKMVDMKVNLDEIPEYVDDIAHKGKKKLTDIGAYIGAKKKALMNTLDTTQRIELKNIIAGVNEHAAKAADKYIKFYNKGLKGIRDTAPFVAAGVIAGFVAGVAYNVMKAPVSRNDA